MLLQLSVCWAVHPTLQNLKTAASYPTAFPAGKTCSSFSHIDNSAISQTMKTHRKKTKTSSKAILTGSV